MAISCPLNAPAPILIRASAFMVVLALTCSCSRPTPALTETPAQWRDPHSLKPQPSRLSVLSPEQKVRIEKLQAVLAEVDNSDVAKWEDDFERDRDPERELRSWESIAIPSPNPSIPAGMSCRPANGRLFFSVPSGCTS